MSPGYMQLLRLKTVSISDAMAILDLFMVMCLGCFYSTRNPTAFKKASFSLAPSLL